MSERFWAKVHRRGPDECWPWLGTRTNGYGRFRLNNPRRLKPAHVVAWELENGPMPEGMWGLHECDNSGCCNPKHVYPGTHAQNVKDMVDRRRHRTGDHRGSKNPGAILTEKNVRHILDLIAAGQNNTEIGKRFGVTHSMISRIRRGLSWPEITGSKPSNEPYQHMRKAVVASADEAPVPANATVSEAA